MRIMTIVGARPQFIKAKMLSKLISERGEIEEIIVHTGQHYDSRMSDVFFEQLKIPLPDFHLGIGSGNHGEQTGQMLIELEKLMLSVKPDAVLVYGDTNSTLAGSLAAAKLHIPVAHVEAGLRSFNMLMPEEINRILTDHVSAWLFCPSQAAVNQLVKENASGKVLLTGDIMYDALLYFQKDAAKKDILSPLGLQLKSYYIATVHRAENTDNPVRLRGIFEAFLSLDLPVIMPLHPRTKKKAVEFGLVHLLKSPLIHLIEPLDYLSMLSLTGQAKAVLTDSGGLQKEACMLKVPCVTLRDETEWMETVEAGWNYLAGADAEKIRRAIRSAAAPKNSTELFGTGRAAEQIYDELLKSR